MLMNVETEAEWKQRHQIVAREKPNGNFRFRSKCRTVCRRCDAFGYGLV